MILAPSVVISSNASLGVAFDYAVARIRLIPSYASKLTLHLRYGVKRRRDAGFSRLASLFVEYCTRRSFELRLRLDSPHA